MFQSKCEIQGDLQKILLQINEFLTCNAKINPQKCCALSLIHDIFFKKKSKTKILEDKNMLAFHTTQMSLKNHAQNNHMHWI